MTAENLFQYEHLLTNYHLNFPGKENGGLIEKKRTDNRPGHAGFVYDILSPDGIHFRHSHLQLSDPSRMQLSSSEPFYHLCFSLRNNSFYSKENVRQPLASFRHYEYNVLYVPHSPVEIEWTGNAKTEVFELNLSRQLLESYIPGNHPYLQRVNSNTTRGLPAISKANIPMTPQLTGILLDIVNCPLKDYYKRLFIKAKVFELLSLVFSHMSVQAVVPTKRPVLKDAEVQKMQQAREILHRNLQSPCSLIDLAHQVGTNENYLKKHFKVLYGNTVFGYLQDLRMQQAKTQLVQNEEIHRIAKAVGYKNTHHFSVAFKKYFGYSPHAVYNMATPHSCSA